MNSDWETYVKISNSAMFASVLAHDLARSSEKMADPNLVNSDEAWSVGPYICSPSNKPAIIHDYPYVFRMSSYLEWVCSIIYGENPQIETNGRVKLPETRKLDNGSVVEHILAKLSMIEQYEIYKDFLRKIEGPINKVLGEKWQGIAKEYYLQEHKIVTNRRNELVHEIEYLLPSMEEAVKYFYKLRKLAEYFNDKK